MKQANHQPRVFYWAFTHIGGTQNAVLHLRPVYSSLFHPTIKHTSAFILQLSSPHQTQAHAHKLVHAHTHIENETQRSFYYELNKIQEDNLRLCFLLYIWCPKIASRDGEWVCTHTAGSIMRLDTCFSYKLLPFSGDTVSVNSIYTNMIWIMMLKLFFSWITNINRTNRRTRSRKEIKTALMPSSTVTFKKRSFKM